MPCVVCGTDRPPVHTPVLWPGLVAEWELSADEAAIVDRREGEQCADCGVSLRSASLAAAILEHVGWAGTLEAWVASAPSPGLLEINRAGGLTPWLERLPGHRLVEFPAVDIEALPDHDGAWDLLVHSETLEHVEDPVRALRECRRVLAPGGALVFTIPVVPGRLTRRRDALAPSHHGLESDPEYRVVTEYGADFWTQVLAAGFATLELVARLGPDAVAYVAAAAPSASIGRVPAATYAGLPLEAAQDVLDAVEQAIWDEAPQHVLLPGTAAPGLVLWARDRLFDLQRYRSGPAPSVRVDAPAPPDALTALPPEALAGITWGDAAGEGGSVLAVVAGADELPAAADAVGRHGRIVLLGAREAAVAAWCADDVVGRRFTREGATLVRRDAP